MGVSHVYGQDVLLFPEFRFLFLFLEGIIVRWYAKGFFFFKDYEYGHYGGGYSMDNFLIVNLYTFYSLAGAEYSIRSLVLLFCPTLLCFLIYRFKVCL